MAERSIKLAVVIINYRTPDLVTQCLASLQEQLADVDARVIVVDNLSQDDSVAKLRDWLAAHDSRNIVGLIESGVNGGFSSGNNLGIRAVDADYYLLLNSDTIV